jgi:hypothetical protein
MVVSGRCHGMNSNENRKKNALRNRVPKAVRNLNPIDSELFGTTFANSSRGFRPRIGRDVR